MPVTGKYLQPVPDLDSAPVKWAEEYTSHVGYPLSTGQRALPDMSTSLVHCGSDVEMTNPSGIVKDASANDMASIETVATPGTR